MCANILYVIISPSSPVRFIASLMKSAPAYRSAEILVKTYSSRASTERNTRIR